MQQEAIPQDSDKSAAIGESLSRALLEKALRLSWCHESTTELALWLVTSGKNGRQSINGLLRSAV